MDTILIAIEGSDGTGKATQSHLLENWFKLNNLTVSKISFPRYKETAAGMALSEMLKGNNKNAYNFVNIDPLAASLFYAADRRQSLSFLKEEIAKHDAIIFDRYVESNLLHQGGKFKSDESRNKFADTLYLLEYRLLEMPHPHVTLYLNLPVSVAIKRAKKRAEQKGEELDAVESNEDYIKNSHEAGLFYAQKFNWLIVPCVSKDGYEYSQEEISSTINALISERLGLPF